MKIDNKEYEEISEEDAYELVDSPFAKGIRCIKLEVIKLTGGKVTRYFREVKPAPEFPIKIEMSNGAYLTAFRNKAVDFVWDRRGIDTNFISPEEDESFHNKDINGILKALLYLETEYDIIKRLKELGK